MSAQGYSDTENPYARFREVRCGVLAFLLVLAGALHADEMGTISDGEAHTDAVSVPVVPAPIEVTKFKGQKSCIRRDKEGRFEGWMDYQHCVYSGRSVASARWFDDLFGDWSDEQADMLVRVISVTGWDEENGWSAAARVRARVALPNASARMRLVITDEDDDVGGTTQKERGTPRVRRKTQQATSIALRVVPREKYSLDTDLDVGVKDGPDIYARVRVRRQWGLTKNSIFSAGQTFRYGTESLGVSTSQLVTERVVSERAVMRLSTVYRFEEDDHPDGFVWSHGVSMSHVFENFRDASLGYGYSIAGHTRPNDRMESYGSWLLWRQSFLRSWLYYEVEPRLTRYRELSWDAVPSIEIRLEAQFGHYKK
ncbi:MAG TPA: hypothetical protein PKY03_08675 [Moraxellaceae bacterium]|nr:hypothetical protein [Moraxellaceae bacterium]